LADGIFRIITMSRQKKDNTFLLPGLLACGLLATGVISLAAAVRWMIYPSGYAPIGAGLALIAAAICFTSGLRAVIEFTKD